MLLRMSFKLLLPAFCLLAFAPSYAQEKPPTVSVKELLSHATHQVKADYPPMARAAHVTGDVVVGVALDETGKILQTFIIGGPAMLQQASIDAAKQWTFSPVEVGGKPSAVVSGIVFKFHNAYAYHSD